MPARLVTRGGTKAGLAYVLGPAYTSLGRGPENDIILESAHASRTHARIEWDGDQYLLRDLGSKNGVTVNGHRLTGPHSLSHGDIIEVPGATLLFDVSADTLTVVEKPAAEDAVIRVDPVTSEIWVRGKLVQFSAKEFLALVYLYQHEGALISKDTLASVAWPEFEGNVGDYSVEQLISRLRRKLEEDPERPRHLLTVRGLGYRLVLTPREPSP